MVVENRPRILLISRYRHLSVLVERSLEASGLDSRVATTPEEGLRLAGAWKPAAVLVDDRPSRDKARTTVGALRKLLPADTAIVWLGSRITRQLAIEVLRAGVSGIVVRPTSVPDLLQGILRSLDRVESRVAVEIDTRAEVPAEPIGEAEVWKRLDRADSLSAAPFVVQQVLSITTDDDAGSKELAEVIRNDPNTTAVVLKRVNSPIYAAARKVTSIQDAITRLGFREVRCLVLALSVIQKFGRDQQTLGFEPAEYWKQCVARAILARNLARRAGVADTEMVYVCGLLRDIGKIICDQFLSDLFEKAVSIAVDQGISLVRAERSVMGTDHAAIGKAMLDRWSFPQTLTDLAGLTSMSDLRPGSDPAFVKVVRLVETGDQICRAMGLGDAVDRILEPLGDDHYAEAGLSEPIPDDFVDKALPEIAETWKVLGAVGDGESAERAEDAEEVPIHEAHRRSVGLLRLAMKGCGVVPVPVAADALPDGPAVLGFQSVTELTELARSIDVAGRPYLIVLPSDQFPVDDEVKRSAGLPVGRCTYFGLPADVRRLRRAITELGE